jgi:hypothetical protein
MKLRKVIRALVACMALGAFAANAAQGATEWTVESSKGVVKQINSRPS